MNAAPKPLRPARIVEVYEIQTNAGTVELDAGEVDRRGGQAIVAGVEVLILWKAERVA